MISDSLWLDLMEKRIGETPGVIVIDDARFDNEAKQVSRLGGLVVELYGDTSEEDGDLHASEVGISPFLIDNQFYNSRYNKTLALDSILSILNVDQELQEWEEDANYDRPASESSELVSELKKWEDSQLYD